MAQAGVAFKIALRVCTLLRWGLNPLVAGVRRVRDSAGSGRSWGATLRGVEWGSGFRADDLYQSAWKYFHTLSTGLADSSTWLSAPGLGWGEELVGGLRT